ncbi:MAG: flagellar M-ring protein FliF [Oscillospiraceae bacterium]|jgi:flagellar M-ring protein FliF|nr:flagellar M-ring protein FliF [Oscillospiraceae bacterium]
MKVDLKGFGQKARDFWNNLERKKKIIYGVSVGGALSLFLVIGSLLSGAPSRVTVYEGLESSEAVKVVSKLRSFGIDANLENGGRVSVPKKDSEVAAMQLSIEGFSKIPSGYDIFKEGSSLLSSDSEKRIYFLYQLQDRLEKTIETIEGVNAAAIHIALPEDNSFVLDEDKELPSASVKLTLGGFDPKLSAKQVAGIKSLIARSVPRLEADRVVVVDNAGNLLESDFEKDSNADVDLLQIEDKADSSIKKRVLSVLEPMFGKGNVMVAVRSRVDLEGKETTETTYGNGVIQHREEATAQDESSKPQTEEKLGGIEENAENFKTPEKQEEKTSSAQREVAEDFLVNKREERVVKNLPTVETVSVAVAVNKEELTDVEKTGIARLVASAAGLPEDRVVLYNMKFSETPNNEQKVLEKRFLGMPLGMAALIGVGLVLILGLVVVIVLIRARRNKKQPEFADGDLAKGLGLSKVQTEEVAAEIVPEENVNGNEIVGGLDMDVFKSIENEVNTANLEQSDPDLQIDSQKAEALKKEDEQNLLDGIAEFIDENVEAAAQFIKTWIRSED